MGMWYPQPKPLTDMSRSELLKHVRNFRESYEKITTRNQDLGNERLLEETDKELRNHLKWYFSDAARIQSDGWLRDYKP
jgi:t-SNARE complex subunit (syntaxin)